MQNCEKCLVIQITLTALFKFKNVLHLMLGVSPLPGEDKPEECPDLHQGREDEQEQIEDPFSRPKLGSDELCASDLDEKHHHSEILNGL